MRTILTSKWPAIPLGLTLSMAITLVACGSDGGSTDIGGEGAQAGGTSAQPRVVVTTSILGDIVDEVLGDAADVETVMPVGADPHEFSASTRQAEDIVQADLLVVNGAGFEAGLGDLIDRAASDGVPVFAFADHVRLLPHDDEEHDHGDDDTQSTDDEAHEDETDDAAADAEHDDHGGNDPHLWTDPLRVAEAVQALPEAVADLDGVDTERVNERATAYAGELMALHREIESLLHDLPAQRRVLVTNHEVFGYFADRYDFEVVGTVIPSLTTLAEPSVAELEDLAEQIEEHGVPAIFAETTHSAELAETLAGSVGDVEVVELYAESLGEEGSGAETYVALMRSNAKRIADALD